MKNVPIEIKKTICHEWGHALMDYLFGYGEQLKSLVVFKDASGYVESKAKYKSMSECICTLLAGKGAEKVMGHCELFALRSTGKESDLAKIKAMTDETNAVWECKKYVEQVLSRYKPVLECLVKNTIQHECKPQNNKVVELTHVDIMLDIGFALTEFEDVVSMDEFC